MFTTRKKIKIQGKTAAHKGLLMRSLVTELIRNERIKTTPKKAKALKATFDKLVTKSKLNTEHSKRQIESFFNQNERSVQRFYFQVENKLKERTSGYTKLIRTLPRKGDNAEQMYVMIVNSELKEKKSKISETLVKQEKKEKKSKKKETKEKKTKVDKKESK